MFALRTFSWTSWGLFVFLVASPAAAQDSTSASHKPVAARITPSASPGKHILFDDFVDSVILQELRLTGEMRRHQPIIETYIQEEGARRRFQEGISPNGDDYFLSRLTLTGNSLSIVPFADEERRNQGADRYFVQERLPFNQLALAQALFPDLDHFDRQNYTFQFVRWELLGELRCAAVDVRPHGDSKKRGFVGRIWVENRDYSIVRFTGTFTSRGFARRAFHFDSWRLDVPGIGWMPAYMFTEELDPHDSSSHRLWFRAQTRLWGYGLQNASDHDGLTDAPARMDSPQKASSNLNPADSGNEATYPPEDIVVERAQAGGLLAPPGEVDQILQTVLNNLLITNNLDIPGIRCRVLLTTPLESFVMGRTVVLSRGLLDVLPDEATLAAVLAHELAHIVLDHPVSAAYLTGMAWPYPEAQIFAALDFRFDRAQEEDADKKARELFSNSPYKDQLTNVALFSQALNAHAARFPNLLHGRFANDFRISHLVGMQTRTDSPSLARRDRLDQVSALPIGSRIVVDPWSDRIEMLKSAPVRLRSPAEKIPFEVTPFHPHLKRVEEPEKTHSEAPQ